MLISKARNINPFMLKRILGLLIVVYTVNSSCSATYKNQRLTDASIYVTGPKTLIYKTRKDYSMQVPIELSADKMNIISYPDIKDVFVNGKYAIPTSLYDGFQLDNQGISANVAFLKLSYQQYASLTATPSPDSLRNLILDSDPLTVLYDCGRKVDYQNLTVELNNLIETKDFSRFKKLK
jgi:hypothetical protein